MLALYVHTQKCWAIIKVGGAALGAANTKGDVAHEKLELMGIELSMAKKMFLHKSKEAFEAWCVISRLCETALRKRRFGDSRCVQDAKAVDVYSALTRGLHRCIGAKSLAPLWCAPSLRSRVGCSLGKGGSRPKQNHIAAENGHSLWWCGMYTDYLVFCSRVKKSKRWCLWLAFWAGRGYQNAHQNPQIVALFCKWNSSDFRGCRFYVLRMMCIDCTFVVVITGKKNLISFYNVMTQMTKSDRTNKTSISKNL